MRQTTSMIDSVHSLERTGMSREQAEALTELLRASITEAVQHLATKDEVDAQLLAIRAELAELGAQVLEVKAGLVELKTAHKAQAEHTDAQIALLRGELTEKIGTSMKYMALSTGFSTVAIIAALFAAFFGMPAGG